MKARPMPEPFRESTPGEYLRDAIELEDMTPAQLARRAGLPLARVRGLLADEIAPADADAVALSRVWGQSVKMWRALFGLPDADAGRLSLALSRCGVALPKPPGWEAAAVEAVRAWIEARGGALPARGSFAPLLADFRAWEAQPGRTPAAFQGKDDFARVLVAIGARSAPSRPTRGATRPMPEKRDNPPRNDPPRG